LFPGRAAQVFYDFGEDPEREYEVREILDHAWDTGGSLWFRIKWGLGDLTWEPLTHCDELTALDDYLLLHGVDAVENLNKESKFPSIPKRGAARAPRPPRSRQTTRLGIVLRPNEGQLWR
jgi:hypothetical protein